MPSQQKLPLHGITVLEFCQYLSGPSAGLRLADLGARVIKIENPKGGDACRKLAIKNLWVGENSLLFHTINRNKESFTADLKSPKDMDIIRKLIARSDVMIHNFRPGVMQKMNLDYVSTKQLNERLIYAEINGYGTEGPWKNKPGQDLLLQAMSGLMYTSGSENDNPVPFGLAIGDILCGAQLVQGILAALIRRQKTGKGALIEISMLESLLDFQFELLTTFYASNRLPQRSAMNGAHTLLGAPYGIYKTQDGYMAIAMVDIKKLASTLACQALEIFTFNDVFPKRDEIKNIIAMHLAGKPSSYWLPRFREKDLWAVDLLNWKNLLKQEGYKRLNMEQTLVLDNATKIVTTRCPIRLNGERIFVDKPAPSLGQDNEKIVLELGRVTQQA